MSTAPELYPYQVTGSQWLSSKKNALLADVPGLGKTAQAIRAANLLGAQDITVLCPAHLRSNWKREFQMFDTGAVLPQIASYNSLHAMLSRETDVLILDESHYLKTRTSKRTQAVFGDTKKVIGLASAAAHVFCLSGTPAPNNSSELWPMMRALMPETLDKRQLSYWGFVQRYCRTRDNGFGLQIVGSKNSKDLAERLAPYMMRRKKEDVLPDLPPVRFETLLLDGEALSELYLLEKEFGPQITQILEVKGADGLREIAPHVAKLRRATGVAKVGAVVATIVAEQPSKIVIGAYHTSVVSNLALLLADFNPVTFAGDTPQRERETAVERFQTDPTCRVFIGQMTAAGTGLTLTAASEMIIVESSWVPAENEQFAMRIHRIGQKNACRVRFATLANSLDEKINRAVLRKTADIAALFN